PVVGLQPCQKLQVGGSVLTFALIPHHSSEAVPVRLGVVDLEKLRIEVAFRRTHNHPAPPLRSAKEIVTGHESGRARIPTKVRQTVRTVARPIRGGPAQTASHDARDEY